MNPKIHNLSAELLIYTRPGELIFQLRKYAGETSLRFVIGLIQISPHSRWTTYSIQEPLLYESVAFTSPEAAVNHGEKVLKAICVSGYRALVKPDEPLAIMLAGLEVVTLEMVKSVITALQNNDPGKLVNIKGVAQEGQVIHK